MHELLRTADRNYESNKFEIYFKFRFDLVWTHWTGQAAPPNPLIPPPSLIIRPLVIIR